MSSKRRWSKKSANFVSSPKIDAFLREVIEVSKRHSLSISHEDHHGSFEVEEFDKFNADWLFSAAENVERKEKP